MPTSIQNIRERLDRLRKAEAIETWRQNTLETAADAKLVWLNPERLATRPRDACIMPTPEDMEGTVAIAFTQGARDMYAQVLINKCDDGTKVAYIRDLWYLSRACACAIEQGLEQQLLNDIQDVFDATTNVVSPGVIRMCKRHAKAWGADEKTIALSLVCTHYGMVAEENFAQGAPRLGKSLKLYGVKRLIEDHTNIQTVVGECRGKAAEEIEADFERLGVPKRRQNR